MKNFLCGLLLCGFFAISAVGSTGLWWMGLVAVVAFYAGPRSVDWAGPKFASLRVAFEAWRIRRELRRQP